ARLVPGGRDAEVHGCTRLVPDAGIVAGNDAEAVLSGTKVSVEGLTARRRLLPAGIAPFELVAEAHLLRNHEAQRGVVNFEIADERRKTKIFFFGRRITLPVGHHAFHLHRRWYRILLQMIGVQHLQDLAVYK